MVDITETFFAEDSESWREWLKVNHDKKHEIWLILYKKHMKDPCVSYEDAVRESLCFGWIDGIMKRIDDKSHVIRFTPRRKSSIWSRSNLKRVGILIEEGRMRDSGMEIYLQRDPEKCAPGEDRRTGEPLVPEYFQKNLDNDPELEAAFNSLAPSQQKQYLYWITSAKKEETRTRRIRAAIEMIRSGKRPGMR